MERESAATYALLQPLRDLAKNWDIDIASELEDYLSELSEVRVSLSGGPPCNFVEAAFIIQNSSVIYSKKVDFLYNLVNSVLDYILTSTRVRASRRTRASTSAIGTPRTKPFLLLDDELAIAPDTEICLPHVDSRDPTSSSASSLSSSFFLPETLSYRTYGYGGISITRQDSPGTPLGRDSAASSVSTGGDAEDEEEPHERLQFKCLKGYVDPSSGAVLLRFGDAALLGQEDPSLSQGYKDSVIDTEARRRLGVQLSERKRREQEEREQEEERKRLLQEQQQQQQQGRVVAGGGGGGDEIRLEQLKERERGGDGFEDDGGDDLETWRKWIPLDPHSRVGIDHFAKKKYCERPFKKKTKFVVPRFPKRRTGELPVFGVSLHRGNVLSVLPFEDKVSLTQLYHSEFDYFASLEKERIRRNNRLKRANAQTSRDFGAGLVDDDVFDETGDFQTDGSNLIADEIGDLVADTDVAAEVGFGDGGGDEVTLEDLGGIVDAEDDLKRFRRRESAFFDERFSLGSYQARFSLARMGISPITTPQPGLDSSGDAVMVEDDRSRALEFVNQTYEDLCRAHVSRYMANTDAFLRESRLEERLAEWKRHLSMLGHRFDGKVGDDQMDMLRLSGGVMSLFDEIGDVVSFERTIAACAEERPQETMTELHRIRYRESSIARAFIVVLMLGSQGCLQLLQEDHDEPLRLKLLSRDFKIDIPNIVQE